MSTKKARSGGKYNRRHTTVTATAGEIADIADGCSSVHKISIGFIAPGLRSISGQKRLKVRKDGSCLLLLVRGNITLQEIRLFATDLARVEAEITEKAAQAGFRVTVEK